jgi:hypothetical protein
MTPQALCELLATLTALLDSARVDIGDDAHGMEIMAHIRTLPVVGHWGGASVRAYDAGPRIIITDEAQSACYWALCREALDPIGKGWG